MKACGLMLLALLVAPFANADPCQWGVADPIVNDHCDPAPNGCLTPEQRHQCDLSGAVMCPPLCHPQPLVDPPNCVSREEADHCALTLAVYCPPACTSNGGGQNSTHTETHTQVSTSTSTAHGQGPQNADFAVKFAFQSYDRCVHDLSMGAASNHAGVHLPPNIGLEEYCHRLYPHGLTGVESATLQVTFTLHEDTCVDQLTEGVSSFDGTVQFEDGGDADSVCRVLFGSGSGGVEVDHLTGGDHTNTSISTDPIHGGETVNIDTSGSFKRNEGGN